MQFFDPPRISKFMSGYPLITAEEVYCEYGHWLRHIDPNLLASEKKAIIKKVRSELGIPNIELNLSKLNVEKLVHIGNGSDLMNKLDIYIGRSSKYICPPVSVCIFCNKNLQKNNAATQVVCHTVNGPKLFSKLIYRCRGCKLEKPRESESESDRVQPQDVYYHPDKVRYT